MNPFDVALPSRIVFGSGRISEVGKLAREFGNRALLVTGRTTRRAVGVMELLSDAGVENVCFAVPGEPTTGMVGQGVEAARIHRADLIIALGGGSAIDAGKAIAAMAANPGTVMDYLEVVGAGRPLLHASLPFVAIPTTAGTGAEATRNAVLASPAHKVKASLRSAFMLPRLALIDPELTYTMAPETTATTGMDALTQLIEAFVTSRANALTDALCRDGITRATQALPLAYAHAKASGVESSPPTPEHAMARQTMALASLWSGVALANAGLGAVHGLAGPLGGMYDAPHGGLCASLLPGVMMANIEALRQRAPAHPALDRYAEVARMVTRDGEATAEHGVESLRLLCQAMRIPALGRYGVDPGCLPLLISAARAASSMKANPIELTDDELGSIVLKAL